MGAMNMGMISGLIRIDLKDVKDIHLKEFFEVDLINSCEDLLIDLDSYAGWAAFAQAEAACQRNTLLKMIGSNRILHQADNFRRSLEMA